ncbi:MAG: vWA domain-containing protein [Actinomycetota bacterium]|nr:vWA domain-containing protein [Actinomycetota bacterium]
MSEQRRVRDRGMTLPELLISVMVTGLLAASMAAASQVVLRQNDNSSGRLSNARSQQSVGAWLPGDLASAEFVDDNPAAVPCVGNCPAGLVLTGSNTLLLRWSGAIPNTHLGIDGDVRLTVPTATTVSYRYVFGDRQQYDIIRVECVAVDGGAPTCQTANVIHNVDPPPDGVEYLDGQTKPVWVMLVTLAVDPAAPGDGTGGGASGNGSVFDDPTYYYRVGRRVSVTINGGGDIADGGGGTDRITVTAGGTRREPTLSTTNLSATPTFAATRSRCGGNFGLLVDTSGSISGNMGYVRTGVKAFIDAFAGTPIKLQIVSFDSASSTLGAAPWSKYYDMLVESDVTTLKGLVDGLDSNGSTNWEDGIFRLFRNADGTVQQVLPDTVILFTDGIPTRNRTDVTSADALGTMVNDDIGLPASDGRNYNQLSWNRANRILRQYEADLEKLIGVYVGVNVTESSTWLTQGPGYHFENYLRGYHEAWERGFHLLNPQRGSHTIYEYANSGLTYQYANGLTYQYAASGQTWQYAATGMKFQKKSNGQWKDTSAATYFTYNTNNGTGDNYRTVLTGTLGSWTNINATPATAKTKYDQSNTSAGQADGFRNLVTGTLGSWSSLSSKTLFDITNTTYDSNDGYRPVVPGTITGWTNTTKAYYDTNNAVAGTTDGYKVYTSGTLGSWTATTTDYYNRSNTTTDSLDGYREGKQYTAPYDTWEAVTDAAYLASNTTTDNSDGWYATIEYTAPFTTWTSVTQSAYDQNNTTPDSADGWQVSRLYTSPYSSWEATTASAYTSGNTVWGSTDGWDATKVYTEPYTFHEGYTSSSRKNTLILKDLIDPGGVVPAQKTGAEYTNAKEATYYELPTWDLFAGAMTSMALAECGGTITLQTKVGTASAPDPFTYQSSVDMTTATTSAQFRSGTFDFDLAGGISQTVTITPLITTDLSRYQPTQPIEWTCRSAGVDYPFTTTLIDGGPWTSITLTVAPNKAISCINSVTLS